MLPQIYIFAKDMAGKSDHVGCHCNKHGFALKNARVSDQCYSEHGYLIILFNKLMATGIGVIICQIEQDLL